MQAPKDQDNINTVSHNGAYLHRDFQAHTRPIADSAGLCSRKKSYSRL